ncbi:maturation protein [ssRNA phage SRR7976356_6]|uniref:Maturation protein n=1 Tax=ssRNA phage SRR7976356_6 TaxID=2786737 RepID=A0A8S5L282_9VIRU|nr:maturation protein [ssRNA phage SRR7976356_6]DAD51234.1 TPA_asm: maturation protein [ssRNA phage SRR7976356_6]
MGEIQSKSVNAYVVSINAQGQLHYEGQWLSENDTYVRGKDYTGPRVKRADRSLTCHEFSWQKYHRIYPRFVMKREDGWYTSTLAAYPQDYGDIASRYDLAYNAALDKAFEALRGNLDVSIDLLDWRKSAQLASTIAHQVRHFMSYAKSIRHLPIREASKKWLEYNYGVAPTLQTIYDAYNEIYNHPEPPLVISAKARDVTEYSKNNIQCIPAGLTGSWGYFQHKGKISTRCLIQLRYAGQNLSALESLSRWTSLNPLSILYERTGYSFVLDWFLNVGGYIRNFETALVSSPRFVDGFHTMTVLDESVASNLVATYPGVSVVSSTTGLHVVKQLHRQLLHFSPMPRTPRFKVKLGAHRLANAAALLGNFVTSKIGLPPRKVQPYRRRVRSGWSSLTDDYLR